MRRFRWAALSLIAVLVAAPFIQIHGMRLIGFEYSVFVNNATTVCPRKVIAITGNRITLDDGTRYDVEEMVPPLGEFLSDAENQVSIDPTDSWLYTRSRIQRCGFSRPERCQLLTIPIIPKRLFRYGRQAFSHATLVQSDLQLPVPNQAPK
jgi:hypothetical protein